jgi:hypothetical protein
MVYNYYLRIFLHTKKNSNYKNTESIFFELLTQLPFRINLVKLILANLVCPNFSKTQLTMFYWTFFLAFMYIISNKHKRKHFKTN